MRFAAASAHLPSPTCAGCGWTRRARRWRPPPRETGVTVARIALEHGFAHPGRFAVTYRERFAESPAVTL